MTVKGSVYRRTKRVFHRLFEGRDDMGRKVLNLTMMTLVVGSIWIMYMGVDPRLTPDEKRFYENLDEAFIWVFLAEYLLRFWVCSDFGLDFSTAFHRYQRRHHRPSTLKTTLFAARQAVANKAQWMLQPLSLVDLLAILPLFRAFRMFRFLRVFRLLKLFRYSKRLSIFGEIIRDRFFELNTLFFIAVVLWGMTAIAFYVAERADNPNIGNIWESIYWTMITITTVGYGDITPVTPMGRAISIFGTMNGMWIMVLMTSIVVSSFSVKIASLKEFKMTNLIDRMENHIIVCGLDTLGRAVCRSLEEEGRPFVGIDVDPEFVERAQNLGWVVLQGDATREETWRRLGLRRAHSVISTLISESDNVYIILLVREQSPDCFIVSTGESRSSENRLMKVGANRVITPYLIGGSQLAHSAIRPTALQFLDLALKKGHIELELSEVTVPADSSFDGVSLAESNIRKEYNVMVVGISRQTGHMFFNPAANETVQNGDVLICLGHVDDLKRMQKAIGRT